MVDSKIPVSTLVILQVVLENSCRGDNHECPFAASSIELVKLMGQLLGELTTLPIRRPVTNEAEL